MKPFGTKHARTKQTCNCGHCKTIHYLATLDLHEKRYRCRFPGCACEDYEPSGATGRKLDPPAEHPSTEGIR